MIVSFFSRINPSCMSSETRYVASDSKALAATIESQKEKEELILISDALSKIS
jgi:hypothetical protein